MTIRNLVEIDATALRDNVRAIKAAAAPRALIAVVKADAYGLGLERAAPIYAACGADLLAVAAVMEARRLRRVAPRARVLLLGPTIDWERHDAIALRCECCVSDADEIQGFCAAMDVYRQQAPDEPPVRLHLVIDTGMGRLGCLPDDAPQLVRRIQEDPRLHLAGILTHYPMAADPERSQRQEDDFAAIIDQCGPLPPDCLIHKDNSEGSTLRPATCTNAVRVGLLLTGVVPTVAAAAAPHLRLAATWRSSVVLVKHLPAGHAISYDCQHILSRDSRVAIIPVGYADGYPVAASGRAQVLIHGERCAVLGRVTMDYLIVDTTDLSERVHIGDDVVLFGTQRGNQGDDTITPGDIAAWAGTISYEIICGLRGRCGFQLVDERADARKGTELA